MKIRAARKRSPRRRSCATTKFPESAEEKTPSPRTRTGRPCFAAGRNLYGDPDQCIQIIDNSIKNYSFNILTTTFNFGGIPHDLIKKSMRLFAKEVMPAFR